MSLLDELAGLPLDQILQHLGPSLLTSPAIDTSTPVDPGMSAGPMNAQAASIGIPQMPAQATPEQMAAQQAPEYRQGFPEGRTLQKLLDAIAPVPEPYKQLLSGDEQRRMQLQSLGQIGGGLTGAYTRPGESQWFGQNLTRGMDASHETMNTALEPTAKAVGLGALIQRQQLMQHLSQMQGAPKDDDYEGLVQWHQRRAAIAAPFDPAIAHAETAQAQVAREMMKQEDKGGDAMELVQFGPYKTNFDKKAGLIKDPIPTSKTFGQMVTPDTLGEAPLTPDQRATLADVQERMRTQKEQFGATRSDRAVNTFQTTKENATAIASADVAQKMRTVIAGLRTKNPQALADAPVLMARLIHEGGVGRLGIIKQMTGVDPSVPGQFEAWAAKHINGTMPEAQIKQLEDMVNVINDDNRKLYTANYERFKKAFPDEVYRVPSPEEKFGTPAGTSGLVGSPKY